MHNQIMQLKVLQRDLANVVLDTVMSPNEFNPTLFYLNAWTGIAATLLLGDVQFTVCLSCLYHCLIPAPATSHLHQTILLC